jgi:hypothetical protein
LKVREDLNATKKLSVAFFFAMLLLFDARQTWSTVDHAIAYFARIVTLGVELLLLYTSENDENAAQRTTVLALIAASSCLGLAFFIVRISLLGDTSSALIASSVRNFTYSAVNILLFMTAYKDYKLFGSGLKEYYQKKHTRKLGL